MTRNGSPTVILVPWYERLDFEQLLKLTKCSGFPKRYDAWLDQIFLEMRRILSSGFAMKIVTVHVDSYFFWLRSETRSDCAEARADYIGHLAQSGSTPSGYHVRTDMAWPGFPLKQASSHALA